MKVLADPATTVGAVRTPATMDKNLGNARGAKNSPLSLLLMHGTIAIMSTRKEIWDTKRNAEVYNAYTQMFPMYRDTSKDLVTIANIKPGMIVIDLAAGTGTTTQAILRQARGKIHIIAIDQAEAMLEQARVKFTNHKNIRFVVAEAEKLSEVIDKVKGVDAVVCNAAFWQMRPKQVFKEVSKILKREGVFAFNLPDQFFNYQEFHRHTKNALPYHFDDIIAWGNEVGLTLTHKSVKTYHKSAGEIIAFNQIPVMEKNFSTKEERDDFFARLKQESEKQQRKQNQWLYLVFRKIKEGAIQDSPLV